MLCRMPFGVKLCVGEVSMQANALQVCGKKGHCAGFVGSVYHDCPYKVGGLLSTLPLLSS